MRLPFLIFAVLLVFGCTAPSAEQLPEKPTYERVVFEGATPTDEERAACEDVGGTIEMAGRLGWQRCLQTFSDGGETCSDTSDCIGKCLKDGNFSDVGAPAMGKCAPNDNPFGCYQEIIDGVTVSGICVD